MTELRFSPSVLSGVAPPNRIPAFEEEPLNRPELEFREIRSRVRRTFIGTISWLDELDDGV